MKSAVAPAACASAIATHSGEYAQKGDQLPRDPSADARNEKSATGGSWPSKSSAMRPFMSDGPSMRTYRGRTRAIVSRTSRAHAGLWWRTPTIVSPTPAPHFFSGAPGRRWRAS